MSYWKPIKTAPKDKDKLILLFGKLEGEVEAYGTPRLTPSECKESIVVGSWFDDRGISKSDTRGDVHWDESRWLLWGCDFYGVTVRATHWAPLPENPNYKDRCGQIIDIEV